MAGILSTCDGVSVQWDSIHMINIRQRLPERQLIIVDRLIDNWFRSFFYIDYLHVHVTILLFTKAFTIHLSDDNLIIANDRQILIGTCLKWRINGNIVALSLTIVPESITNHNNNNSSSNNRSGTSVSLGKRKKSTEELNNNNNTSISNNSSGATTIANAGHEEDGVNVEDSGDEGSLSRGEAQRKKKARTTFTGRQIFELEKQFELKKYLSSSERADMAKLLNVTETQVGAPQMIPLLMVPFYWPCSGTFWLWLYVDDRRRGVLWWPQ